MEILAIQVMKMKLDLSGEMVADLLIAAHRHEAEDLKKIALDRIKGDKKILDNQGFREGMKEADPNIMIDLIKDF